MNKVKLFCEVKPISGYKIVLSSGKGYGELRIGNNQKFKPLAGI